MFCNVGGIDRILRIVVGIAVISLYWLVPSVGYWAFLGAIPLLTGLAGFCPAYTLIGVNTCKK